MKAAGARLFRGGAYKPRTSPYSFQGLGEAGLEIMAEVRKEFGLGIITEAIDHESLDLVEKYADVIQIGARNMQNFSLLKRAGRAKKPVLLKRGMSATLDEFLMAAEYLMSEGNYNVILCERGVRTFSDFTRNTLDLAWCPLCKSAAICRSWWILRTAPGDAIKCCRFRAPRWRWARMDCWWKSITIRTARFPTGRNPSCPRNLSS